MDYNSNKKVRLNKRFERVLNITYALLIVLFYNGIRMYLSGNVQPEEFYNNLGYIFFTVFFIVEVMLIFITVAVHYFVQQSDPPKYFVVDWQMQLIVVLSLILFFEVFLVRSNNLS